MRLLLIVLLATALVGCGAAEDPVVQSSPTTGGGEITEAAATAEPTAVPDPTATEATAASEATAAEITDAQPTADPTATSTPTEEGTQAPMVLLEPDGLGVTDGGASITHLPFQQTEPAGVISAVEGVLGAPTGEAALPECGLDAVLWAGFAVYSNQDGFVGWYLQDPPPVDLTTVNGVGLGLTRTELHASASDVSVQETTIGTEWAAGGLSGTLTGADQDDTVDVMWAGLNCIAR